MIIQTPSELITEPNSYLEFILIHALRPAILEEFVYRFIVLGIFMLYFLDKFSEDSRGIKEVVLDGIVLAKLGVRFPYRFNKEYFDDIAFVTGLILSSLAFASIHIWGYGWGKIPPTIVMGILLGWIFLRYGLLPSITIHFFHNFVLITSEFFFLEYELLVEFLILPGLLFIISMFFEYLYPVNSELII